MAWALLSILAVSVALCGTVIGNVRGLPRADSYREKSFREFQATRYSKPSPFGRMRWSSATSSATAAASKGTFSVLDYGADPAGIKDSAKSIQNAIEDAQKQLWNEPAVGGNVAVSLEGGSYLISKPLNFSLPWNHVVAGRLTFRDGGLMAGWNHSEGYLLQGDFTTVYLESLNLDARHRGGCIDMHTHEQTFIHNVFFSHFSSVGLNIGDGHELLVDECNFEEYAFSEDQRELQYPFTGTAILVGSPDNQFWNIIVKCCKQGIITRGQNIFSGIHLWPNCANFSISDSYSFIAGPETRIWGSYMDGSGVLLTQPANVHITDSWFYGPYGGLTLQLNNTKELGWMHDVIIRHNTFHCHLGCPRLRTLGLEATTKMAVHDVIVRDNHFDNQSLAIGTYAQATHTSTEPGNEFSVDFTGKLLFPVPVQNCHVQYSFQLLTVNADIGTHFMIPSKGLYDVRVFIVAKEPVNGRVFVSVDQSNCTDVE
ncbi:uncharacterized protein LOC135820122 [Sycon ciliatum]|uniref:uncharacterized protein LOC135820122 n=1 Tax=Sycon ciliatum TaxID=27933 RepID=UPI0031F628CD